MSSRHRRCVLNQALEPEESSDLLPFALDESPGGGAVGGLLAGAADSEEALGAFVRMLEQVQCSCCLLAFCVFKFNVADHILRFADSADRAKAKAWCTISVVLIRCLVRMLEQAPPLHGAQKGAVAAAATGHGHSSERQVTFGGGHGGGKMRASQHMSLAAGLEQLAALRGGLPQHQPAAVAT